MDFLKYSGFYEKHNQKFCIPAFCTADLSESELQESGMDLPGSGVTNMLLGIWFTDDNRGTVVGVGGTILNTVNGGKTWINRSISRSGSLGSLLQRFQEWVDSWKRGHNTAYNRWRHYMDPDRNAEHMRIYPAFSASIPMHCVGRGKQWHHSAYHQWRYHLEQTGKPE